MLYTIEEMKAKLEAILKSDNAGVMSEVLVDLQNNYTAALSTVTDLTAKAAKLESDNKDLIIANGNLFQAVGVMPPKDKEKETETDDTMSIEDTLAEMLEKGGK